MITADKPPLEEAYLEHFGVKGMKWGQRKSRSSSEASDGSRKATLKKVAKGAAVVGGAAAVALLMTRRGRSTVSNIMGRGPQAKVNPFPGLQRDAGRMFAQAGRNSERAFANTGRKAATPRVMKTKLNDISQSEWRSRVSSLSKDIAGANAEQDRWMRSQGLGAAINRG